MARNDIIARGSLDLEVCIATKQHLALLNPAGNELKSKGVTSILNALEEGKIWL